MLCGCKYKATIVIAQSSLVMMPDLFSMMMHRFTCLLFFVLILSGCVTSERIVVDDPNQFDSINLEAVSRTAKVVLLNGDVYLAASLQVAEDSTRFTGRRVSRNEEVQDYVVSTDEIKRILLNEATPKIGNGLAIGAATSFLFGFTIGYFVADGIGECRSRSSATCFEEAAYVGGLFGLGGGLLGGLVGAAHRRIQVYTFHLSQ